MDFLVKNRFTTTTLLVLGANPLIVVELLGALIIEILVFSAKLLPFLPFPGMFVRNYVGIILAIALALFSIILCLQNLERVGYKKIDVVRLFIPIYGVYFAFQIASKFTMSSDELAQGSTNISPGGMTF